MSENSDFHKEVDNNSNVANSTKNGNKIWNLVKAFICLLIYVSVWEAHSITAQEAQKHYTKPYLIAWLRSMTNIIFFAYYPYMQYKRKRNNQKPYRITRDDWKAAALIHSVYFLSTATYVFSLQLTIVNISNTICMGSSVYSYILSIIFLKEEITSWKNVSILLLIGGNVFIVMYGNEVVSNSNQKSNFLGYLLLISSEILFSMHSIIFVKMRKNKNTAEDRIILIALFGVFNAVVCLIPIIPLHFSGLEKFELPPAQAVWWILANMATKPLSSIAWYSGLSFSGPVFMAIGTVLILPIGNVTELLMKEMKFSVNYYIGMVIILSAFVCFSYGEFKKTTKQNDVIITEKELSKIGSSSHIEAGEKVVETCAV